MSESGGGGAGVFIGAGVGGAVMVVVVIAVVIYCYLKARKEKSNTNMTKSNDIFTTGKLYFILFGWTFTYMRRVFRKFILSKIRWDESEDL